MGGWDSNGRAASDPAHAMLCHATETAMALAHSSLFLSLHINRALHSDICIQVCRSQIRALEAEAEERVREERRRLQEELEDQVGRTARLVLTTSLCISIEDSVPERN